MHGRRRAFILTARTSVGVVVGSFGARGVGRLDVDAMGVVHDACVRLDEVGFARVGVGKSKRRRDEIDGNRRGVSPEHGPDSSVADIGNHDVHEVGSHARGVSSENEEAMEIGRRARFADLQGVSNKRVRLERLGHVTELAKEHCASFIFVSSAGGVYEPVCGEFRVVVRALERFFVAVSLALAKCPLPLLRRLFLR